MAKKKLTKKQKTLLRKDVLVSVLIASILLNLFFLVGVGIYKSSNALDQEIYEIAYSNYCDHNYEDNLQDHMASSENPELTKLAFEAECRTGDFLKYYQNAYEAYLSDNIN